MARPTNKRPENLGRTVRSLARYMGRHTVLMVIVGVLAAVSALANLLGTYMIRPIVNSLAGGDGAALVRGVVIAAAIYGTGVLAALGYTQTMVRAAQKSSMISAGTCSPICKPCRCRSLTAAATATP